MPSSPSIRIEVLCGYPPCHRVVDVETEGFYCTTEHLIADAKEHGEGSDDEAGR